MLTIRLAQDRGVTRIGWLDSRHTFSFGEYSDPAYEHFGPIRVINDDRVAPGGGFGKHPHRDMEILSYVLSGELEHRDSMGTGSVIRLGDVQRMTAGTGIYHSEFNPSKTESVHFLQIWVIPEKRGLPPGYEQKSFPLEHRRNSLQLLASRDGREGSVLWHQDVDLFSAVLGKGASVRHTFRPGRSGWIQVASGSVTANGQVLSAGDGAAVTDEEEVVLTGIDEGEVLLFDLPRG